MGAPLAERLRPKTLEEWIGHEEFLSQGKSLFEAIRKDELFSFLLYAPPGVGKTSLCLLIKKYSKSRFVALSAVTSGVKDIKDVIEGAKLWKSSQGQDTILFIDEIHRFNKAQQDSLLAGVERGDIVLIGATTENPSFELNSALLSRLRVIRLEALRDEDLVKILERAQALFSEAEVEAGALQEIATLSFGDARSALNAFEQLLPKISVERVGKYFSRRSIYHDKTGDLHYQVVSAFIKSMRASEVDAALYYMARLWEAGEDPLFIARRMVIFASEDIGNADIRALAVANAARQAAEFVGRPECYYALSQAAIFLSRAPKSREVGDKFQQALEKVRKLGPKPPPGFLVNAPGKLDKGFGRGREREAGESFFPEA